jgi:hypothetical protein
VLERLVPCANAHTLSAHTFFLQTACTLKLDDYTERIETKNRKGVSKMKKESIYTVCKKTNVILRVSRTFLSACEFSAMTGWDDVNVVLSRLQNLKKGQQMVEVAEVLQ